MKTRLLTTVIATGLALWPAVGSAQSVSATTTTGVSSEAPVTNETGAGVMTTTSTNNTVTAQPANPIQHSTVESQTVVKTDGSVKTSKQRTWRKRRRAVEDTTSTSSSASKSSQTRVDSNLNETGVTGLSDEGRAAGSRKVDASTSVQTTVDK